jgi:adenine phosphoribosyltransferase
MDLRAKIRTIPDYPKPGILFRDITTLLGDRAAFHHAIQCFVARYRDIPIDVVAAVESRGFILGAPLAYELGAGFVPIRKKGRLPAQTIGVDYELEYGVDRLEVHVDAVTSNQRVLVVDDLVATGGTALAACHLVQKTGGTVVECCFVIDLPDVHGRSKLERAGFPTFALCTFDGH